MKDVPNLVEVRKMNSIFLAFANGTSPWGQYRRPKMHGRINFIHRKYKSLQGDTPEVVQDRLSGMDELPITEVLF
jgi:hypothetical protein